MEDKFILDISNYGSLVATYKLGFMNKELLSHFSYIEKENNISIFGQKINPCSTEKTGVFRTTIDFYGKKENIVTLGSNCNILRFREYFLKQSPIIHNYENTKEKTDDTFFCTLKEGSIEIKLEFDRDDFVMISPNHCAIYSKEDYIDNSPIFIGEPNKIIYFSRRGIETNEGNIKTFESINSHSYEYKLPLKETVGNKLDRTALFDTLPTKVVTDDTLSYYVLYDKHYIVEQFIPENYYIINQPKYCRYEKMEWEKGEETIISIHPNFYDPFSYIITYPWEFWCKDKAIIQDGKIISFEREIYKCNDSFVIDIMEVNKKYSNQLICSDFFKK